MDKNTENDQKEQDSLEERYDSLIHSSDDGQTNSDVETTSSEAASAPEQSDLSTPDTAQSPLPTPSAKFNLNKYFLYTLVGGLIISALISVSAVLISEFNSTVSRALGTTISMVIHTLVALWLISIRNKGKKPSGGLLTNTLLLITVASFITSVLSIWEVITGQLVGDLYGIYFYTFCASLWSKLLLNVGNSTDDELTRITSRTAIGFTALLYVLLIPTTLTHSPAKLPDYHYRTLAATAILLATVSVLATVFHRIHLFKHPELKSLPSVKSGWDIAIALLVLFVGLPFIFFVMLSFVPQNSLNESSITSSVEENQTTNLSAPVDNPSTEKDTDTSVDSSNSGKSEVTQKEIDAYNATAGVDCTSLTKYSQFDRDLSRGTVSSIDLQAGIIYVKHDSGSTLYGRWKNNTLPQIVSKDCSQIQLTDIRSGDLISIYDGDTGDIYHDAQDIRVIQKLN